MAIDNSKITAATIKVKRKVFREDNNLLGNIGLAYKNMSPACTITFMRGSISICRNEAT